MNWKELSNFTVYRVDDKDLNAVKVLYENCSRMSTDTNLNVSIATLSVDIWFDDFLPILFSSVDYISNSPLFMFYSIENKNLYQQVNETYLKNFNSFDEMCEFIKKDERFETFVLFSICKYVNLTDLNETWTIRYREVDLSKEEKRNKKIKFLTNGIDNN
jgi:hypothetical protein